MFQGGEATVATDAHAPGETSKHIQCVLLQNYCREGQGDT